MRTTEGRTGCPQSDERQPLPSHFGRESHRDAARRAAVGENFPDALGAGPAAGLGGGPVLLVQRDSIPSATLDELNRLKPDRIVIMGGTAVVSTAVENTLAVLVFGPTVERIGGANRYDTAGLLSAATFPAPQPSAGVYKLSWLTTSLSPTVEELDNFTVSVPGPGVLWVQVAGTVWIDADAGGASSLASEADIGLCDTSASFSTCGNTFWSISYQDPDNTTSTNAPPGFSITRVIPVAAAGDVTLYVNGHRDLSAGLFASWNSFASVIYLPNELTITG